MSSSELHGSTNSLHPLPSQGGDLFDAIATDIKYSEQVARDMIHDLADALQVLLDSRQRCFCFDAYKYLFLLFWLI